MTEKRVIPAPLVSPENKPYFDAAAAGKLLIKRCTACGQAHFYPRALCPHCFGETEWREAAGSGTIYSYSVMRHGAPFAVAYVTLDEGVTMLTNLVDCDFDALRIGQKLRVVFRPAEGGTMIPMFTRLPEEECS
jgi:uncharacterized OB-fold protein